MVSSVIPAFSWALLAASLVVGLAALLRMAGPATTGGPDLAGVIRLPAPLTGTIAALFAVSVLLFAVGVVRRLRSRRHPDEEIGRLPEAARTPAWLRTFAQLMSLVNFAVLAYLLWRTGIPLAAIFLAQGGGPAPGAAADPAAVTAPPLVTWTFGVLALAAAVGALALALWVAVSDRLAEWWERPEPGDPAPASLAAAVEESLEDLSAEPDARRAITRCYARFERAAADSGLARRPWLTPAEFTREALERLPVPRAAVAALTGLFELARFSQRALGDPERGRALAALREIGTALEEARADAAAR
jgi:hypothetical protein